jgi:hypothetical protein
MSVQHSTEFGEFTRSQREVNHFLWSSEFAYELILQKVLTPPVRSDPNRIHKISADVDCHAFVPGTKTRKAIETGKAPRHGTKYEVDVATFEMHLRDNLEPVCRYVIIRFHSALERFLWFRCKPLLRLETMTAKERRNTKKRFQQTSYLDLEERLKQNITLERSIDPEVAIMAQAFRMLRNEFIRKEREWAPPWSDSYFRQTLASTFGERSKTLIRLICDPVKRKTANDPRTPTIFFYALFCLTAYRRLALEVEQALPLQLQS